MTVLKARIKVCGVTSVADASAAVAAGADAIGLVFYPPSPRYISIEQAREIAQSIPPFVTVVGLFVDASEQEIEAVLDQVPLTLLQFHGKETDAECQRWGRKYIKALRVRPDASVEEMAAEYPGACGLLLDTYRKGVPGGTGESFNWQLIPRSLLASRPIILAGGLGVDNVGKAIEEVGPYAVDVSSRVESAPGIKDHDLINAFFKVASR